jgi:hypothetical protein
MPRIERPGGRHRPEKEGKGGEGRSRPLRAGFRLSAQAWGLHVRPVFAGRQTSAQIFAGVPVKLSAL